MDKKQLFTYFDHHYLSRRDVSSKLPLNIPISTFWPELQKIRQEKATILPLYNAQGQRYWYVLTNNMVAASERICEEAMKLEKNVDPYRTPITSAMMEEIFYTGYVEGATIPLQKAMAFLNRGTEPESVEEQMIWNNRQALLFLTQSIFQPIDDQYVKSMAMLLTDGLDNAAVDYRKTDHHKILAMGREPYEVLPSASIDGRMMDYYAFMGNYEIPPLIKAAVGQAYILVTRPFSEGNERLARMISQAVLLRNGYDFFRDISLSAMIAKEGYLYYKSMCEIIRKENGGDMTYFIEYFLILLAKSLDDKNNKPEMKKRENIEQEQALAKDSSDAKVEQLSFGSKCSEKEAQDVMKAIKPILNKLLRSPVVFDHLLVNKINDLLDMHIVKFTLEEFCAIFNLNKEIGQRYCLSFVKKKLMYQHMHFKQEYYSFYESNWTENPNSTRTNAELLAVLLKKYPVGSYFNNKQVSLELNLSCWKVELMVNLGITLGYIQIVSNSVHNRAMVCTPTMPWYQRNLELKQKITSMYNAFHTSLFHQFDLEKLMKIKIKREMYSLFALLMDLKIIEPIYKGKKTEGYRMIVTPETHPEFFHISEKINDAEAV